MGHFDEKAGGWEASDGLVGAHQRAERGDRALPGRAAGPTHGNPHAAGDGRVRRLTAVRAAAALSPSASGSISHGGGAACAGARARSAATNGALEAAQCTTDPEAPLHPRAQQGEPFTRVDPADARRAPSRHRDAVGREVDGAVRAPAPTGSLLPPHGQGERHFADGGVYEPCDKHSRSDAPRRRRAKESPAGAEGANPRAGDAAEARGAVCCSTGGREEAQRASAS
mmetsp:Transcript_25217/g.57642  ORF Transcript_25217/g.57642 Transcript_25217/m.57642 type:complete len:227 (+) Transcript_25217:3-683(+)